MVWKGKEEQQKRQKEKTNGKGGKRRMNAEERRDLELEGFLGQKAEAEQKRREEVQTLTAVYCMPKGDTVAY